MIFCSCAFLGIFVFSCTLRPSETGTYDNSLDAEVKEIRFHDSQLELLGSEIDSLQGVNPRHSEQESRLKKALERKVWHEGQREEAIRRANEKGQNWNMLYNSDAKYREEDRTRRNPPR